jgi:adenosylhomocysteine nucleosidase
MKTKFKLTIFTIVFLTITWLYFGTENSATGVLGALNEELLFIKKRLTNRKEIIIDKIRFITGKVKGREVVLARIGVGKVNASMITTLLIKHFNPGEIIFTGIAGGINPGLLPGDIVIAEKTAHHDLGILTPNGFRNCAVSNPIDGKTNPIFFPADEKLLALADLSGKRVKFEKIYVSKIQRFPKVIKGIIVTGDMVVSSSAKKLELRNSLQADAVEMEGAAVAQICWQLGIPCLVIRCLSDTADKNTHQDVKKFYKIAARNSSMLALHIIEQLSSYKDIER